MPRDVPSFEGEFETHITLELPVDTEAFRRDCGQLGVKPIVIELPAGSTSVQPMTSGTATGTLESVLTMSRDLWDKLKDLGYHPTRLKIEAGPTNQDLPETDAEAMGMPGEYYFEHHLKVAVKEEDERRRVEQLCSEHQAHLSKNALKSDEDGRCEYFVTVRSYGGGRTTSDERIDRLVRDLEVTEIPVLKRICEYCVHDSLPGADDGWP